MKCSKCECHLVLPELFLNIWNSSTSMSMLDLSGQNKFTTALSDHSYVSLKLCSFMFIYMLKVILVNSTSHPKPLLAQRSQKLQHLQEVFLVNEDVYRTAQGTCE